MRAVQIFLHPAWVRGSFRLACQEISIRYRQRFGFASLHLFSTNRLIPMDAEQYQFLPSPCDGIAPQREASGIDFQFAGKVDNVDAIRNARGSRFCRSEGG